MKVKTAQRFTSMMTMVILAAACLSNNVKTAGAFDYDCHLECHNGGTCRWRTSSVSQLDQNTKFRYMACDCRDGFAGQTCSIPVVRCPDGHQCFHGSICVNAAESSSSTTRSGHGGAYQCDCSVTAFDTVVVGNMCQHVATESCELGKPNSRLSFCTNGGRCRKVIDSNVAQVHSGCDCPDGFDGPYCDHIIGEALVDRGVVMDEGFSFRGGAFVETKGKAPLPAAYIHSPKKSSSFGKHVAISIGCVVALVACAGALASSIIICGKQPSGNRVVNIPGEISEAMEITPHEDSENISVVTDSFAEDAGIEKEYTPGRGLVAIPPASKSSAQPDKKCVNARAG